MRDESFTATRSPGADERSEYLIYAEVAEAVAEATRNGREPDVEVLMARYPGHAEHIRQLIPTLLTLNEAPGKSKGAEAAPETDPRHRRLGDFRLLREIGRGGMGVVYEAQQISLGRRVALKVLPFAAVLDQRQLQRFKNEAQAAAQLHHTNIVPVYGVGCERGVHYYAMQYIDGQTLGQVVGELRRLSGQVVPDAPEIPSQITTDLATGRLLNRISDTETSPPPTPAPVAEGGSTALEALASAGSTRSPAFFRSVAQLGVQAAEALEHAHQEGVFHRDIKPGNLILDARGHLWVTDFGLARIESDPGLTITGDILGTVRYMSPEQALAQRVPIDHRTDIYSLGVTLYELLTLQPIFAGRDRQELLRQIAFEEPLPLRKVNPPIPGELETIVLKAMRKNPAERYASAAEFADDLNRFLEYKPIKAKPPSMVERTGKWCRRHPGVVGSAVALLVMAVVALSISTVLISQEQHRTQTALTQARESFAEAETQRQRAQANFQLAREAVDQMLTRVAEELENQPHMEQIRRDLLEDALAFYERFLGEEGDNPTLRHDTGNALRRVASINSWLGDREKAEEACRRSVKTLEQLVEEFPEEPGYQSSLATSCQHLGRSVEEPEERKAVLRQALAIADRLTRRDPENAEYRSLLAEILNDLGIVLSNAEQTKEAETSYRRSLELLQTLVSEYPAEPEYRFELARIHNNLGVLLGVTGRKDEQESAWRKAVEIMEELVEEFPGKPGYRDSLAFYLKNLGNLLAGTQRYDEAVRLFPRAFSLQQNLIRDFSSVPRYQNRLAYTQQAFVDLLNTDNTGKLDTGKLDTGKLSTGKLKEAEQLLRQALQVTEHLSSSSPHKPTYTSMKGALSGALAKVLEATGQFDEAEESLRKAVNVCEQLATEFPEESEYLADLRAQIWQFGSFLERRDRPGEGRDLYVKLIKLQKAFLEKHPADEDVRRLTAITYRFLARNSNLQGDRQGWIEACQQAVRLIREHPADHELSLDIRWELGLAHRMLGKELQAIGRVDEAEKAYRGAIETYSRLLEEIPNEDDYLEPLLFSRVLLSRLLKSRGRLDEAEAEYQAALALRGQIDSQWVALAKESADGVAQAVEQARLTDMDEQPMTPFALLIYGEFLTLGGDAERGAEAIQRAIDHGGHEHWYQKSLGLALVSAGRSAEAATAFTNALQGHEHWSPTPPDDALPDHWTAAYFLDLITQEQYTKRWRHDDKHQEKFAPFPWFHVGWRAESEGRIDEAIAAYEKAVELGRVPNAHHTANFAAYRRRILTGRSDAAAEDLNAALLAEEK